MFFFFKQKTAYEMRISDWSSDVCSSDLPAAHIARDQPRVTRQRADDRAMFAMRAHRADDRLGAQAGQRNICVWVTSATSVPASVRMRVCHTDSRFQIFTGTASPTSTDPTGPAPNIGSAECRTRW